MISTATYYSGMATMAYVLSCLFFAAVRWFHMCHPYDQHPNYYYPGRKAATFFFTLSLLLLPHVCHPDEPEAQLLVRWYYPLTHFYCFAISLFVYFGTVKHWHKWRRSAQVATLLVGGVLLPLFVASVLPDRQFLPRQAEVLTATAASVSLLMTLYCALAMWHVWQWMRQFSDDNYSNPDDFPLRFAQKTVTLLTAIILLIWTVTIVGNRWWLAAMQWGLVVLNVASLIAVLHPKRLQGPLAEEDEETEEPAPADKATKPMPTPHKGHAPTERTPMSEDRMTQIERQIRQVVEGEQLYLHTHLKMQEVAERCRYGRTYVSQVFSQRMGGFFTYINHLRLLYAEDYQRTYPQATQDEVAQASGFTSRQAYYGVRKRMKP